MHIIDQKIANDTYKELAEGLSGGCDDQGEWERKMYLVPWIERSHFIQEIEGKSRYSGGRAGQWITNVPYTLPDNPRLYAREVTFEPEGQLLANVIPIAFTHAKFTVVFRQPSFNYSPGDDPENLSSLDPDDPLVFATQELDFAKEWMSIPNSSCKFKSDGKFLNSPINRSVTVVSMQITWHKFPVVPMPLVQLYCDSVNNAKFLGCEKGTVMFEGARTTREASADGSVTQKVTMNFKWRQFDWNKSLRDDGFTWDLVVDKGYTTGDPAGFVTYVYRDFSKLLLNKAILASGLLSPLAPPPGP